MATTYTGEVFKCEMRQRTDEFGARRCDAIEGRERYLITLNIGMRTADGKAVYFDTPAAKLCVRTAGGAAVVLYKLSASSTQWFRESGGSRVATANRSEENRLIPLVSVGDTITVRGTVKRETAGYTAINRVKRLTSATVEKV